MATTSTNTPLLSYLMYVPDQTSRTRLVVDRGAQVRIPSALFQPTVVQSALILKVGHGAPLATFGSKLCTRPETAAHLPMGLLFAHEAQAIIGLVFLESHDLTVDPSRRHITDSTKLPAVVESVMECGVLALLWQISTEELQLDKLFGEIPKLVRSNNSLASTKTNVVHHKMIIGFSVQVKPRSLTPGKRSSTKSEFSAYVQFRDYPTLEQPVRIAIAHDPGEFAG